jgi:hypothetical protein
VKKDSRKRSVKNQFPFHNQKSGIMLGIFMKKLTIIIISIFCGSVATQLAFAQGNAVAGQANCVATLPQKIDIMIMVSFFMKIPSIIPDF